MTLPDVARPTVPPEHGETMLDIDEDQPSQATESLAELSAR